MIAEEKKEKEKETKSRNVFVLGKREKD